jgi:hypothetical protein
VSTSLCLLVLLLLFLARSLSSFASFARARHSFTHYFFGALRAVAAERMKLLPLNLIIRDEEMLYLFDQVFVEV